MCFAPNRRQFIKSILAAGAAPLFVPAHVLGADGQTPPSGKITRRRHRRGSARAGATCATSWARTDVRVTAICDVNQRNLDRAQRVISPTPTAARTSRYSRDFRELNADPSIDAVLMALPVHWHSIPALDAILHGKHIYHEKPMGMSFEEARRVRAAVRKKGVVFQFGTQQRSECEFRLGLRTGPERAVGQAAGDPGLGARAGSGARCSRNSRCRTTWIGTAGWVRRR